MNAHELMQRLADTDQPEAEVLFRSTSSGDDPVTDIEVADGRIILYGAED